MKELTTPFSAEDCRCFLFTQSALGLLLLMLVLVVVVTAASKRLGGSLREWENLPAELYAVAAVNDHRVVGCQTARMATELPSISQSCQ